MQVPDLSSLTPVQFVGVLVIVAVFDWITGIYGALRGKTFDPNLVLDVLFTHGVKMILPIAALFAIGYVSGVVAFCALADLALAGYIADTVLSAADNVTTKPA